MSNLPFLSEAAKLTADIRAGRIPPIEELREWKRRNRELADRHALDETEYCDHLPTWINQTNSTVCNLRCDFCNQAYGKGVDWRMEEPVYRQIVEELYPFVEKVQLTAYGEPMMTPNIKGKIADMERFGVELEMVTNATLMKGEKLLGMMAKVLGLLTVSIDGATAKTYNNIRIGADLNDVIANVKAYNRERHKLPKEQQAPLHLNTIIMKRTIEELPQFMELAKELDAQRVTVYHLVVFEDAMKEQSLDNHRELTNEKILQAKELAEKLNLEVDFPPLFPERVDEPSPEAGSAPNGAAAGDQGGGTETEHSSEPEPSAAPTLDLSGLPTKCFFLWHRMYLGPFGDVVPCCLSGIHPNGNHKETTIASVWNNDLYREMRRRVHTDDPYPACKGCYLINRVTTTGKFDRRPA